ncbi:MAG: hypothetical protein V3T70_08470, partial [Phycisphaerae bacterium]
DGRPITCVGWWGSYIDPAFEPIPGAAISASAVAPTPQPGPVAQAEQTLYPGAQPVGRRPAGGSASAGSGSAKAAPIPQEDVEVRGPGFARTTLAAMIAFDQAREVAPEQTVVPFNEAPAPKAVGAAQIAGKASPKALQQGRVDSDLTAADGPGHAGGDTSALAPPLINTFAGTLDDGTFIPPDTMGAAGPNHLVVMLNSGFTVYNKAGGLVSAQITHQSFWSALGAAIGQPANFPFDPKILFDQYSDCWVVTADSNPNCRNGVVSSWVLVGISATNDPTGVWYLYAILMNAAGGQDVGLWSDYPGLGVDPNNVVVTNNMFNINCGGNSGPFSHVDCLVISKAKMKALMGPPAALTLGADYSRFHDPCGTGAFTMQPCHTFGQTAATSVNYLVDQGWLDTATRTRRFLRVKSITGIGAAATINCPDIDGDGLVDDWVEVNGYNFNLLNAAQPGGAGCPAIETNDTRMLDAVVRNDKLFCTHTVGRGAGITDAAPADRTEAAWYEIDPTLAPGLFPGGTPNQQGHVDDPSLWYYFPSIAVNSLECVALGFSGSDDNTFASGYYTMRDPAVDPANTMQPVGLLKAGVASYNKFFGGTRNRWGDYSSTCIDPVDDLTFWTIQEYAEVEFGAGGCGTDTGRWGTWWGSFTCAAPFGTQVDGWLVSFHTDLPQGGGGFSQPLDLLGLYFCPENVISIELTSIVGWDGHRVYDYFVELEDCHLIHSLQDPRDGTFPAREDAFHETQQFIYWLDIQAVVGHTFVHQDCPTCVCDVNGDGVCDPLDEQAIIACFGQPPTPPCDVADLNCDGVIDPLDHNAWLCLISGGQNCCPPTQWVEVPTNNRAFAHFWGWHTSPDHFNDESVMGEVVMGPNGEWVYINWQVVDGTPHMLPIVDQAFELLAPKCNCRGDMNFDGLVDGDDIQCFIDCFITGVTPNCITCHCADMNADGVLTTADLNLFVCRLLNCDTSCTTGATCAASCGIAP